MQIWYSNGILQKYDIHMDEIESLFMSFVVYFTRGLPKYPQDLYGAMRQRIRARLQDTIKLPAAGTCTI